MMRNVTSSGAAPRIAVAFNTSSDVGAPSFTES